MNKRIDFQVLAEAALHEILFLLQEWLPNGKLVGNEWISLNPTREDSKLGSFKINIRTGRWSDFATEDAGGDLVSLYAYLFHNGNQGTAGKELAARLRIYAITNRTSRKNNTSMNHTSIKQMHSNNPKMIWTPVVPVPADCPERPKAHSRYGSYSHSWAYRDETGQLDGYVCRFDQTNGNGKRDKVVLPLTYCQNEHGERAWQFKSFDLPRPLYARDLLFSHQDLPVLVVEGEKCAEAANKFLREHYVATTHMAGSNSAHKADWSPLAGRDVVVWPDNDDAGKKALKTIVTQLKDIANTLMVVMPPDNVPGAWDIADAIEEGWSIEMLVGFIEERKTSQDITVTTPDKSDERSPIKDIDPISRAPFRCLGYDRGNLYYLPYRGEQVLELSANQHTSRNLLLLAPNSWWWEYFPGEKSPNWQGAADTLFNANYRTGMYDCNSLRGRGAWYDEGRIVLNCGDYLLVDGKRVRLHEFESRNIYEAGPATELSSVASLPKEQAYHLLEALEQLAWGKLVSAKLMAGWCVLAPISGALNWRPHVLVTGSAGTGKSTLFEQILKPLLGKASVFVLSNTTEAGIRQRLNNDAFPVIFDEAEMENQYSQRRMDHVLELIRQSSSSSGGAILKGSQDGKGMEFRIRSCFCLASIGVSLQQQSDLSRISVLGLIKHHPKDAQDYIDALRDIIRTKLTVEWQAGMRARSIKMIPVIRKNIDVFSHAVASAFRGNMRTGDQLGALLAGAYSLVSDDVIDYQDALTWVNAQDWSEQRSAEIEQDEIRCLNKILQYSLVVNQDTRRLERSIVSLVAIAGEIPDVDKESWEKEEDVSPLDAEATLSRNGIRLNKAKTEMVVSSSHNSISQIMHDTPWSRGWSRILSRLEGASDYNSFRFEAGMRTRAVGIPLSLIFGEGESGNNC